MKFLSLVIVSIFPIVTFAGGSSVRGGGDLCESQIKLIRDDLAAWISKGGPNDLKLPAGVSIAQYSQDMLSQISKAKIICVGAGDSSYPVQVYGTPKVCKFENGFLSKPLITCDRGSFMKIPESDQYVLIHHEYASLSGFELPHQDDSHYEISNQISGYLADQVVKKLVVKTTGGHDIPSADVEAYRRAVAKQFVAQFEGNTEYCQSNIAVMLSYIEQKVQDAVYDSIVKAITEMKSATLDQSGPNPRFIFFSGMSETFDCINLYPHQCNLSRRIRAKKEIDIIVTPDFKSILSLELKFLSDKNREVRGVSGDLAHPVISKENEFHSEGSYRCNSPGFQSSN